MQNAALRLALPMLIVFSSFTKESFCQGLDTEVRNLFAAHEFDPSVIPFQQTGFNVKENDPLIIKAEWELVRSGLSEIYASSFSLDIPPQLALEFLKLPSRQDDFRVRILLLAPPDERVRNALIRHVRCPRQALSDGRRFFEVRVLQLGRIRPKYKVPGGLNLSRINADLLDMVQAGSGPLARYNLSADGRVAGGQVEVLSGWKFYRQIGQSKRYFWRINIKVAKQNDDWKLASYIDVGRQLASQSTPKKVGDTRDDSVTLNLELGTANRMEAVSRVVGTSGNLWQADDVSPLGTLRKTLTSQCLAVLLTE